LAITDKGGFAPSISLDRVMKSVWLTSENSPSKIAAADQPLRHFRSATQEQSGESLCRRECEAEFRQPRFFYPLSPKGQSFTQSSHELLRRNAAESVGESRAALSDSVLEGD
jgi:hypothetical protein